MAKKSGEKSTKKAVSRKSIPKAAAHRAGREKPYPSMPLGDALTIARAIEKHASGQPMRRLTLFDAIGKSPESGPSRSLITASGRYGLTEGGYRAETLSLTDLGRKIVSEETSEKEKTRSKFEAGISRIDIFQRIHNRFSDNKLPSQSVLKDFIIDELKVEPDQAQECIDTFIVNAKYIGVLKEIAGAERVLSIEHVIEDLPGKPQSPHLAFDVEESTVARMVEEATESSSVDWSKTCFYVTPIGDADSSLRRHSDLFLEHIVEPALAPMSLEVVRADRIGRAGMITKRVLEYVVRSKLVVADLSHHNPNVFYELSLRHACRLPTIQIIRSRDNIPFDLKDFDTIQIDDSDIYSLIPKLDVYKSQIATQARSVLQEGASIDNPIITYFPGLSISVPG